jgi:hypothetical protein
VGFRAGRLCIDHIFCLKQIIENSLATDKESSLLFIDLTKAYDTIPIMKLFEVLQESHVNRKLIKALHNLYNGLTSEVEIGKRLSDSFRVSKGLRQGCCISPTLFKIYVKRVLET